MRVLDLETSAGINPEHTHSHAICIFSHFNTNLTTFYNLIDTV